MRSRSKLQWVRLNFRVNDLEFEELLMRPCERDPTDFSADTPLSGELPSRGPRPPLPYEFEVYDLWHRRRVLEVKPGVTGLWQVSGRSRTCFDKIVRSDLRYSQSWSIWLDVKILLATPGAVLRGDGAY